MAMTFRVYVHETTQDPHRFINLLGAAPKGGYVMAEVVSVHRHGCQATRWRRGRGYGKCGCGADDLFDRIVRANAEHRF